MKHVLLSIFIFLALLGGSFEALSQPFNCSDIVIGSGGGNNINIEGAAGLGRFCAPVTVNWFMSFKATIPAGANVDIIVDWDDGEFSTFDAVLSGTDWIISNGNGDDFGTTPVFAGINNAKHIYEDETDGVCFYEVSARLVVDGNICNASRIFGNSIVNYWEPDDVNPGNVIVEPIEYLVCAGDAVTLNFDDNTQFNCINPANADIPNSEDQRNVRWIYNTTDGPSPSGRITGIELGNGVILDGNNPADQNYIPPTANPNDTEIYPAIINAGSSVSTTLDINVPNNATIGEVFEVKLENWGPCNPLGGSKPPIERYAIIRIVAPPLNPSFTISSDADGNNPKTVFCPGENMRFRGNASNHNGNFAYRWEVFDNSTGAGAPVWTRNNDRYTFLSDGGTNLNNVFSSPGFKLVRMYVRNSDTNFQGNCEVFVDRLIEIVTAPIAEIEYNAGGGTINNGLYEICLEDIGTSLDIALFDQSTLKNPLSITTWIIEKIIPTPTVLIDLRSSSVGATTFDYPANPLSITEAGEYRVRLRIEGGSTCTSTDELIIRVYDTPEATFDHTAVCAGNDSFTNKTSFTNIASNLSGLGIRINNDEIVDWEWDFSYNGTFNIEYSASDNSNFRRFIDGTDGATEPTSSVAGDYQVALRVRTAEGCEHLLEETVTVKLNPDADIAATYTNDYLTNLAGDPYTGDPICPGTSLSFTNTSDLAFNADPELDVVTYELEIIGFSNDTTRQTIGAPGSATETVETNIFANSTTVNRTYKVRVIATGANSCPTISTDINVVVLPGADADFLIFDGVPGAAGTNPYSNGAIYCSPYEFYFETDANTQSYGATQYIWTVTDAGTGAVDTIVTVNTATDPNPEQFFPTLVNTYPSTATRSFDVNLAVITGAFCVNSVTKRVKIEPQPTGNFTLEQTVETCPTVTLRFEAEQLGLGAYNWVVTNGASAVASTVGDTPPGNSIFVVEFNRPANGAGDLNYTVELTTQSVVGCPSHPQTISGTISETELIPVNVNFSPTSGSSCLPAVFDFQNNSGAIPTGTTWAFEIRKEIVPASGIFVLQETLEGVDYIGNEDFTTAIQYEFVSPGLYQVDLLGTANSSCIFQLSTPQEIEIFDTPEVRFRTNITEGCSPLSTVVIQENSRNVAGTPSTFNMWFEVDSAGTVIQSTAATPISGTGGQMNNTLIQPLLNPSNSLVDFFDYDITVFAENAAGCIDDSTYTVRVFKEPNIDFDILSTNPACEEDYEFSFTLSTLEVPSSGTSYRWNFGDGVTRIETDPTIVQLKQYINRNQTGGSDTYTVSVTAETSNGCSYTATKNITLNPIVRPGFIRLNDNGCSPFNLQIRGNAQGTGIAGNIEYETRLQGAPTWNAFTGPVAPNGDATIEFTNTSGSPGVNQIYEIRQIVTGNGPCSRTSTEQLFTVFPKPVTPTIVGSQIVCQNEMNVEYAVVHTPGYSYNWSVPEFAFISSTSQDGDTIRVNYGPTPTNATPEVLVTMTNTLTFCRSDAYALPVTVVSGPTGSLALGGSGTICPGELANIIVSLNGPGTDPAIGFDVVINDGFTDSTYTNILDGELIPVSPVSSRNYFIKSIVDREFPNCPGRPSTNNVRVNINTAPTATIAGDATICEGETTELRINMSGLAPWSVSYSDGNDTTTVNSSSSVLVIPVSPIVTTAYTLVSVNDNNCTGTVTPDIVTVTVNKAPYGDIFSLEPNPQICVGGEVNLGFRLAGYGPWTVNYTDGTNNYGFTDVQQTIGSNPDDLGDLTIFVFSEVPTDAVTTYTLTEVVDSRGCVYNTPSSVTVNLLPVPQALMTTTGGLNSVSICEGESIPLNFNFPSGAAPFDLKIAVNDFDTLKLDDVANPGSINIDTLKENTTFRIVSLFDNNGCTTTNLGLPVRVNVRERPTAVLSGIDSICYGEETNIIFNFTGKGPWTVTYNNGIKDTTFTTPFNRHFELVSPLVTTEYTLKSVTDSNSPACSGPVSGTANVEVASELIASFTATPEYMVLKKKDIDIVNTTTNKEDWDYVWDFGDGTISTEQDPGNHEYETYGTYFVTMTATSKNGECSDNFQVIITIEAIPAIVNFDATPRVGCLPMTVQFENLTQFADSTTYLWDFGDNQSTRVINPQHTYTRPGTYRVRLSANNITGVPVEEVKEQFITVYETPEAIFNVRRGFEQVFTEERVEFSNSSNNADQFLWNFGDGNESNEFEPVHMYADSGIYDITLIAINSSTGCPDTLVKRSQVLVLTDGEFKVPNAFTPSRGGQGTGSDNAQDNDFFRPIVNGASQYNLKIFNRWGELLFESNDKEIGWDGYYKGDLMPMGVYVFRLEIVYENGRREVKLGDVTLVR